MPKANKQIIIDALIKHIEKGESFDTCLKLSAINWNLTRSTFIRRWNIANQQHIEKQAVIKSALAEVDKQAAIDARKKAILTAEERKEYLTKIVKGEVEVPYTEVKWDHGLKKFTPFDFIELANHSARIAAISELNKMEGDYAPAKTEVSGKLETDNVIITVLNI